jgi:hypothetical protein
LLAELSPAYVSLPRPLPCHCQTTSADKVCCFSNLAPFLDLLAPGSAITAGGITMSGTSMAAPHVAGAVAVLKAARPAAAPGDMLAALVAGSRKVTDWYTGKSFPRLDLEGGLAALVGSSAAPPDAAAPTVATFTINGGAAATSTLGVQLRVAGADESGVAGMCVTNTASAVTPGACAPWVAYTPDAFPWALEGPAGSNGYRAVRLFLNDTLGNLMASPVTRSIYYDPDDSPPSGTVAINGGAVDSVNSSVVLSLTVADDRGAAGMAMCLSNAPACTGGFQPFVAAVAGWELNASAGPGAKTVYAWFRDAAGNVSPQAAAARVNYDPTGAAGAAVVEGGRGATVAATKVNVRFAPPAAAGAAKTEVCFTAAAGATMGACTPWAPVPKGPVRVDLGNAQVRGWGGWAGVLGPGRANGQCACFACWLWGAPALPPHPPTRLHAPLPLLWPTQGVRVVRALFRSAATRQLLSAAEARGAVLVDTAAPADARSLGASLASSNSAALSWDPAAPSDGALGSGFDHFELVYSTNRMPPAKCGLSGSVLRVPRLAGAAPGGAALAPIAAGTTYRFRLCSVDAAGNVSPGVTALLAPLRTKAAAQQ